MSLVQRIADLATRIGVELKKKVNSTDARLSDAREWTAAEVTQAEAAAGTATTARKWSALRVWQASAGYWGSVPSIEGKAIGLTTRAAAKFTTLEANGNCILGSLASQTHYITGAAIFNHNATGGTTVNVRRTAIGAAGATIGVGSVFKLNTEANITAYEIAANFVTYPVVKGGFSQNGYSRAVDMSALRNGLAGAYDDNGYLLSLQSVSMAIGHYNGSPTATPLTGSVTGVTVTPYAMTGSIANLFALNINPISGNPSAVAAASALRLGFAAATNHKNLDAHGTGGNYMAGSLGIGVQPSSSAKLDCAGPLRWGQYTLSTLPSAAAYPNCNIDVVDATGGITACKSVDGYWCPINTTTPVS
jgi:hypothetical protein